MVQVVAAIIERDRRILICRRTPEQSHALKWEFPGGKVEPGETPQQALERELAEELGIRHASGEEITRYQFTYPGKKPILLIFFRATGFEGEPTNLIFHEMRWEPPQRLVDFDFVEGDLPFLRAFSRGEFYDWFYMNPSIKTVDPAENEFLASLEARSKQANLFFRVMANRPEVLKAFVPFYGAVMGPGSVERRTKELVYLTCAYANRCAYCTAAHTASGNKAGITEPEMQSLQAGTDEGFSEPELAAIRYARELTRTAGAATTRDALNTYFNDEQIVELTLVAATSNWTNRFNNGLGVLP